ncbi:uncharacterized protein A4U43_C05F14610 [Asparagus officinalis]|uniref:Xaa-Pro dipeptidyl-peptidase-like domain-containing protein n=1 Tax=Asparagus officinalis TaxID=4686 RepID=A0A5P1ES89_ASPOF|nr:uncharacterized protein A4U43_C05F14610 [Asparagus officinalis]
MESTTVETSDGVKLHVLLFNPQSDVDDPKPNTVIVMVHPFTLLGGSQGLLRGTAMGLAERGFKAVTFDTRGAGRSSGRASLTGFSEVQDVIAVCKWVKENLNPAGVVLVGSSAVNVFGKYSFQHTGSNICVQIFVLRTRPQWEERLVRLQLIKLDDVVGYVSLGYPFGLTASILFGRHHEAILKSTKPKLFVMGTKDVFTSVKQFKNKLKSASGRVETHLLEGTTHFQMEGPAYDAKMADLITTFVQSLQG